MVINSEGLSSPWIFSLINPLIALYSMFSASKDLTWLSLISIIYTTIRSSVGLIGSWNFLRVHGISGFQYAELSWLVLLSTLSFFLIKTNAEKLTIRGITT